MRRFSALLPIAFATLCLRLAMAHLITDELGELNDSGYLRCHCRNNPSCNDRKICEISTHQAGRCFYKQLIKDDEVVEQMGCTNELHCVLNPARKKEHFCCSSDFCNEYVSNHTVPASPRPVGHPIPAYMGIIFVIGAFALLAVLIVAYMRLCKRRSRVHSDDPVSIVDGTIAVAQAGRKQVDEILMREKPSILVQRTMGMDIKLGAIIGQGSFGKVYEGTFLRDLVAVKIFDGQHLDAFNKENNIFKRAIVPSMHQNILGYKGCDTLNGQLWLITELCPLGSLHRYLEDHVVENVTVCIRMCRDIVSGLVYLHTKMYMFQGVKPEIAHRDLKPSNVFLRKVDGGIQCVIGDFGYAVVNRESFRGAEPTYCAENGTMDEFATDPITHKMFVGTTKYMSPEVLSGTLDIFDFEKFKCSDIYSLSLVMWEIGYRTEVEGVRAERRELPYFNIPYRQTLDGVREMVCDGGRPAIPQWWDSSRAMTRFSEIVQECWRIEPSRRPGALNVKRRLDEIAAQLVEDDATKGNQEI